MIATFDYGRRLIPNIVDDLARRDPERPVYSVPRSKYLADGFQDVSAKTLAAAVDKTAWWLESEVGRSSTFETVGYIGPRKLLCILSHSSKYTNANTDDLRYVLLILACVKTGHKALILSPRNDTEASLAVLKASDCKIWVVPREAPQTMSTVISQRVMKVLMIDVLGDFLQLQPIPEYAYSKTFEEASNDPFCVLHTSGSTGNPKLITWSNSMLGTLDATRLLPEALGRLPWTVVLSEKDRFYTAFPFSHSGGIVMNVLINAFFGTCNVIGPAGIIPNLDLINSLLDHGKIQAWSIVPSLVNEIGEDSNLVEKFKQSKFILASGGPINYESASKVNTAVRVFNITGTTEGLFMGIQQVEPEDWIYFSFHPYAGFEFREVDEGVYEHWAIKRKEYTDLFQGIFHTFPDVQEMSLKDLYTKHPTKAGLWRYKGRSDDLIVLSNGEKVHPVDMEATITSHPAVNGCLIVGTAKFQTALLLELNEIELKSATELTKLIDDIYKTVEAANTAAPTFARIHREYIILTKLSKPIKRTDKYTIKRLATVMDYEDEIEAFYNERETADHAHFASIIDTTSLKTITRGIHDVLTSTLPAVESITLDDDMFNAGLDSLLGFRVVKYLRATLDKHAEGSEKRAHITPRILYANPTINRLSTAFYNLLYNSTDDQETDVDGEKQVQIMKDFRFKYTENLPKQFHEQSRSSLKGGATVVLTGSTGSLGSYLIDALIRQSNIKKIYALNRAEDGREKQQRSNKARGIGADWPTEKVEFLQVDLAKINFGLDQKTYHQLLRDTTYIIHNQWPVNFNWNIGSFEPQVRGVRHLIDFASSSEHTPTIFFVSSIATVSHLTLDGYVPEEINHILRTEVDGYGSAKQVCELLIHDAADSCGIQAVVCRVGQISGPVLRAGDGMWAKQEWLPTIVASSKHLGVLPSTLGYLDRINWIPVDVLANIILELTGLSNALIETEINGNNERFVKDHEQYHCSPTVYHAVNPETIYWEKLVPTIVEYTSCPLKIVSWNEWVQALRNSEMENTAIDVRANPALKLLDFFEAVDEYTKSGKQIAIMDTKNSKTKSSSLASLGPVHKGWMEMWLKQWNF